MFSSHCRLSHISTLALLFTTAGLLALPGLLGGCASSGQDQNYKLLEEDRPMFDTRPDTNKPGEARHHTKSSFIATAPQDQPTEARMDGAGPKLAQASDTPAAPKGDLQKGDLQTAAPTPGDTSENKPATIDQVQDALAGVPEEGRSITGLDRSHWSKTTVGPNLSAPYLPSYFYEVEPDTNVWCLVAFERACFAAQVVALPVKMIITPPWKKTEGKQSHSKQTCGADQSECCMSESNVDVRTLDEKRLDESNLLDPHNPDDQTIAPANNASKNKGIGCLAGNHAGCVLCTCTSLKNADEHTCDVCCS